MSCRGKEVGRGRDNGARADPRDDHRHVGPKAMHRLEPPFL